MSLIELAGKVTVRVALLSVKPTGAVWLACPIRAILGQHMCPK